MKQGKLRRKSKNPRKLAQDKADRALQNFYRRRYPNKKCEVCGAPFQLMHHHNEKSKSNAGRYLKDNLVFICKHCHNSLHFGINNIVAIYSVKRGKKWVERMKKLALVRRPPYTIRELEAIEKKFLK